MKTSSRIRALPPFARTTGAALLATALFHAAPALAQDTSRTLTGNWGGERTRLHDDGVDLSGGYVSEVAGNVHGGARELTRYTDQWAFGARFDLAKLLSVPAATFQISITDRNGRNLSDDAGLQTLQQTQELYGRGQTWRLTQFSYDQSWLAGKVDVKAGRMTIGEDFASFSCDFQNLTFCGSQPGNVRGDIWYNWPVSQWGTRVKLAVGSQAHVQVGVYQDNPRYAEDGWARNQGLYPNYPGGSTGTLIPVEVDWTPSVNGLAGSYKFGGWYDTSNAKDVALDVDRQPLALTGATALERGSSSGVYVNFLQQINGRSGGRGASVFLNITQADKETSTMDRQIALGLEYKGPFDARPDDSLGIAIGSNHVNARIASGVRAVDAATGATTPTAGYETVGEVFYAWKPLRYLSLQPNVQVVRHPGGISSNEAVVVIGLRTSADF
jgi:porin